MGSVASAQSSASAAARRDLRRANHIAPPAAAPTASTTFHFTRSTIAASEAQRRVRCRSMRRLPGALIAVLVVLTACGVLPTTQPAPSLTATGGTPEGPAFPKDSGNSPTGTTPVDVPEAQQFSLDDGAEFDDGLLIEIAGAVADKAAKTDRGAEATNGEIVIASVRIENNSDGPYDAESVLIAAKYGEGRDAQIIVDETDELQSGFTGTIRPNDEGIGDRRFRCPVLGAEERDLHR